MNTSSERQSIWAPCDNLEGAADVASTVKHRLARPLTALFSVDKAHLSRGFSPYEWPSKASSRRCIRRRHSPAIGEQHPRHRDFGHLEDDVGARAHNPGADLTSFSQNAGHPACGSIGWFVGAPTIRKRRPARSKQDRPNAPYIRPQQTAARELVRSKVGGSP